MTADHLTNTMFGYLTTDMVFKGLMFTNEDLYPAGDVKMTEYNKLMVTSTFNDKQINYAKNINLNAEDVVSKTIAIRFLKEAFRISLNANLSKHVNNSIEITSVKDVLNAMSEYNTIVVRSISNDAIFELIEDLAEAFGPNELHPSANFSSIVEVLYKCGDKLVILEPDTSGDNSIENKTTIVMLKGNICEFELLEQYEPKVEHVEFTMQDDVEDNRYEASMKAELSIPIRDLLVITL